METGAYWFKVKGLDADIVWVHAGRVFGTCGEDVPLANYVQVGMFYGPLPPPDDTGVSYETI